MLTSHPYCAMLLIIIITTACIFEQSAARPNGTTRRIAESGVCPLCLCACVLRLHLLHMNMSFSFTLARALYGGHVREQAASAAVRISSDQNLQLASNQTSSVQSMHCQGVSRGDETEG